MAVIVKETATRLLLAGSPGDLKKLVGALAFRPPDYWRSPKYALFKQTDGQYGWDGYLRPLKVKGNQGVMLRGLRDDLEMAALKVEVDLDLTGLLKRPFSGLTADDIPLDLVEADTTPYPHQLEAVAALSRESIGVCELVTSAGKTRMFCMAAAWIKRRYPDTRTLYVVPTERLAKQATSDARGFLPAWSISQLGGGVDDDTGQDLVVATVATLYSRYEVLLKSGWFKTFRLLIVDECAHAGSPSWVKVLSAIPAFFRFGASDRTKQDDPVKGRQIRGLIGPLLTGIEAGPLIQVGHLAKPTIWLVDVPGWKNKFSDVPRQPDLDTQAWAYLEERWQKGVYRGPVQALDAHGDPLNDRKGDPVYTPSLHLIELEGVRREVDAKWCLLDRLSDRALVRFKDRNDLIVRWAEYFSKLGRHTLTVCTRTVHVLTLTHLISEVVGHDLVRSLFSEDSPKVRDEIFKWLCTNTGTTLVSPLVKEGVSLPPLNAGIIADYIGSVDHARQVAGRFLRKKKSGKNEADIVWFIDRQAPSYQRGCVGLFQELAKLDGFIFKHPVIGPDTMDQAITYEGGSIFSVLDI